MKKLISILALLLIGSLAHAGLLDQIFLTSGNMATATYWVADSDDLNGTVASVKVVITPAGSTTDVNVVNSNGETIFAKSAASGSAIYPILIPAYSTGGAALTQLTGVTTSTVETVYTPMGIAGTVTASFTNRVPVSGACTGAVTITFWKQ